MYRLHLSYHDAQCRSQLNRSNLGEYRCSRVVLCRTSVNITPRHLKSPIGKQDYFANPGKMQTVSVGVFAACLPTLKPLFALILPRLFNSTFSSRTNQYPGYGSAKVHTHGTSSWRRSKMMATPPFKNGTGGLFVRDTDSDMDALKKSGSFTPEAPGTDVEMMGYNVSHSTYSYIPRYQYLCSLATF